MQKRSISDFSRFLLSPATVRSLYFNGQFKKLKFLKFISYLCPLYLYTNDVKV